MRESLKDQLLKAGLVDTKKAKEAERREREAKKQQTQQARSKPKKQRKTQLSDAEKARVAAEAAIKARADRDRDLARARRLKEERKALREQIALIVDRHKQSRDKGEIAYNFVEGKKVKHLYVTEPLRDGLARGLFDIVKSGETYAVVKAEIAEKIRALEPSAVVARKSKAIEEAEADYADHPIPDDLDW